MAEELEQDSLDVSQFDPASLPLGTFAPFDVSDQPLWTDQEGEHQLTADQKSAIRAMTDAAAKADAMARRIEIQGAWLLELLDRGMQRTKMTRDGGWEPFYGRQTSSLGVWGAQQAGGYYDTNVIGEKNDIIISLLSSDNVESTFFPVRPDNPDDEIYADHANSLKYFIAEENKYGELQEEVAQFFCTDETAIGYTRPVADAQRWGYEDEGQEVTPESQNNVSVSRRPKIRTLSSIYGKLSRKVPILAKSKAAWQYAMLSHEIDISLARARCPWIASKIESGDLGVAELKLDRLARQSISLAMQSGATGDSLMRDVTETYIWFRPGFYMDDSCPKSQRSWFWENFPKGMLVGYEGKELAFCRNESMDESLTEFHARKGNGQNRRAITESFAGPQMRLNVLVDLRDEFCRKAIPRVGLDTAYWNVDALRASSVRVGALEPALQSPIGTSTLQGSIVEFPVATGTPDITAFIDWIAGPLAEQLTHAMPTLAASETDDPETLGQSKLQNQNARASFGNAWRSILNGFAEMTTQSVNWNARVQPDTEKFDGNFPGMGRVTAEIAKLKIGSAVARADSSASFPESWAERSMAWEKVMGDQDPAMMPIKTDPENMAAMKPFLPKGMVLPGVDAVNKQRAEFDKLLKSAPLDNPQYIKVSGLVEQGQQDMAMKAANGLDPDPQELQALQSGMQALQSIPPMISSVPVPGDGSENDAVEAMICQRKMNSPEGRRLKYAPEGTPENLAFQNLTLHWQQHEQAAQKLALQNQQPIQPKTSMTVDVSKLDPQAQTSALQKLGVATSPEAVQAQSALSPHEVTTTEKGVSPSGSEIERKTSMVGKQL